MIVVFKRRNDAAESKYRKHCVFNVRSSSESVLFLQLFRVVFVYVGAFANASTH